MKTLSHTKALTINTLHNVYLICEGNIESYQQNLER